jgi:hypothetical protein
VLTRSQTLGSIIETPKFGSIVSPCVDLADSSDWPLQCALRLESELYRLFKSGKPYCDKSRSVIFNLQDPKNPNARRALLDKEVTPEDFLQRDVRKFASDEKKIERQQAEKVNLYNCRSDWETVQVKA